MTIIEHFRDVISGRPSPLVFELGANDGHHTAQLAAAMAKEPGWRLIAFEPDARVFPYLVRAVHRWPANVQTVQAAIGAVDGEATMLMSGGRETRPGHTVQNFTGSSSLRAPAGVLKAWPDMTFAPATVRVHTLDKFCAVNGIEKIDFIWADIQGAEVDLLDGGAVMLGKTRYLYTEVGEGLYAGAIGLPELLRRLPDWEVIGHYESEPLLRNNALCR